MAKTSTIRRADLRDLETLVAGNLGMAKETEGLDLDEATLRAGIEAVLSGRAPGTYWVLDEDGAVTAMLLITFEWSDWRNGMVWWIQSVWVPPAHRGAGRFGQLFRGIEAEARASGARGLRLYADERNAKAHAVYRSLGMNGDHYRVFESMF